MYIYVIVRNLHDVWTKRSKTKWSLESQYICAPQPTNTPSPKQGNFCMRKETHTILQIDKQTNRIKKIPHKIKIHIHLSG